MKNQAKKKNQFGDFHLVEESTYAPNLVGEGQVSYTFPLRIRSIHAKGGGGVGGVLIACRSR